VQQVGPVTTGGDIAVTDSVHPLVIAIDTLVNLTTVGTDVAEPMADFDPSQPYSWAAVEWTGTSTGLTISAAFEATTAYYLSGFTNVLKGVFGWNLDLSDQSLFLTYAPVPEPGALSLVAAAAVALAFRPRRRSANPVAC
jgi:hypothetical protein